MGTSLKYIFIAVGMFAAAGLALTLKPTEMVADQGPRINLETMIPKQFGDWRMDDTVLPVQVAADVQAQLNKIYDDTLSRTYVNNQGVRIMLSMAYGGNQSDALAVHKPEVCYPAQGFQLLEKKLGVVNTHFGQIQVTQLVAKHGDRIEPITYWINVGGKQVSGRIERKLQQLRFGITGKVPFGVLIRVSTVSGDTHASYAAHEAYISDLLAAVSQAQRSQMFGI